MKKLNKKGFTIVELVIVIAVIGILSAVLIPTFSNLTDKANESAAIQEASNEYKVYLTETVATGEPLKELVFETSKGFVHYKDSKYTLIKDNNNNAIKAADLTAIEAVENGKQYGEIKFIMNDISTGWTDQAASVKVYKMHPAA